MNDIAGQMARIREMVVPTGVLRGDPFQVLIKTILSHRTKDENTDAAAERLFARFPTPAALKAAPQDEVERLIRSTGFYTVKAARVIEVSRIIDEELGGIVPRDKAALMRLPGVGPKTANCVLVFAYGDDAIPVDTHVHRIANRIGWVSTKTPEETEPALERVLPRHLWAPANELLVTFGKAVCRPLRPRCGECLIAGSCAYFLATTHKREEP
jgi:endonuclease-3